MRVRFYKFKGKRNGKKKQPHPKRIVAVRIKKV